MHQADEEKGTVEEENEDSEILMVIDHSGNLPVESKKSPGFPSPFRRQRDNMN